MQAALHCHSRHVPTLLVAVRFFAEIRALAPSVGYISAISSRIKPNFLHFDPFFETNSEVTHLDAINLGSKVSGHAQQGILPQS